MPNYFGWRSNKSQHAKLKTMVILVEIKLSFVHPYHMSNTKSSFGCLLLFHAKLLRSLRVYHALASLRNRVVDVICSGLPVFCSVLGTLIDAFGLASARRKVGEITRRPAYFKHCCLLLRNLNQMRRHAKVLRMAKEHQSASEAQNSGNIGGNQLSGVKNHPELLLRL